MQNYLASLEALNTAMNLMVEEDDTMLVALISQPRDRIEQYVRDHHAPGARTAGRLSSPRIAATRG